MNKNLTILLFLFLTLAAGTAWYLTNGKETKQTTLLDWDRKFKVEDTDQIHKIFIANRKGEKVTLTRKNDHWIYNNKYKALPNAVDNLMRAFGEVQMNYKPANAAVPNMVSNLATQGIKVELYDRAGEQLKSYYIGGETSDSRGTYMIMEGSEQPYVVHIPTWGGNLRARFSLTGEQWRDKTVLGTKVEEIASVSVEYPKQKNQSFKLKKKGEKYEVLPFYDTTPKTNKTLVQGLVEGYLVNFKSIGAEAFETTNPRKDSVTQTIPFSIITLKKTNGEEQKVELFPIYEDLPGTNANSPMGTYVDRYFAEVNEEEFMLVQHRVFEKVLWGYDAFF
ncbi:MAG: DUF4340 domain-containing protein [Bacteroidota bacterium]